MGLLRRMIFAIALLHTTMAGFSSLAVVLDGRTKESSECSIQDCGSLYLLKSTGKEVPVVSSIPRMKEKDVVGARVVGAGCSPSSGVKTSQGRASWRPRRPG